jgi:uncharacterized protein (TIGR02147 family)
MERTTLNVYRYTDFRAYLKDRLDELKALDAKYSLRFLSDKLGLASKSHLKMVVDGSRNLTDPLARKLAQVLSLREKEAAFFLALVRYTQAKTTQARTEALDEMRRSPQFLQVHRLELDRFDYLADPLLVTLRELICLKGFRENPIWLASRLPMKATPAKIRKAIEKLVRLGLAVRDEAGVLHPAHKHQDTGDEIQSTALPIFYKQMFRLAADALEHPSHARHLGGLTMGVSQDGYTKIV